MRTSPAKPAKAAAAHATAWPVPRCSGWRTIRRSRIPGGPGSATAARTASAWCPTTSATRSGSSGASAASTWRTSGRPASSCSTLARWERMRLPRPAARTTAPSGRGAGTAAPLSHRSRVCSRSRLFLQLGAQSRTIVGGGDMSGRFGSAVVVVGWMLAVAACNPLDRFRPTSVNVPPRPLADDDDQLTWAEQERWVVVVRKACRTLDVYNYGARVRSFPTVFGLNGSGSKLYEGDRRTPSGLYMIVDKRAHPRWRQFLLLDYPNTQDLQRYWLAMEGGGLPRRGDGYVGAGGAVGIHGTDKPGLNARGVDWTWGCISLQNADVDDLARLVPVGTLVLIEE